MQAKMQQEEALFSEYQQMHSQYLEIQATNTLIKEVYHMI